MIDRILLNILLVISFLLFPWWTFIFLSVLGVFFIYLYFEALIAVIMAGVIFGIITELWFVIMLVFIAVLILLREFVVSNYIK